jgi:hypothetical protein
MTSTTIIRLICKLIDGPGHRNITKHPSPMFPQVEVDKCLECDQEDRPDNEACIPHAIAICKEAIETVEGMAKERGEGFYDHVEKMTGPKFLHEYLRVRNDGTGVSDDELLPEAIRALTLDKGSKTYSFPLTQTLACLRRYLKTLEDKILSREPSS